MRIRSAVAWLLALAATLAGAAAGTGPLERQQAFSLHAAPLARALLEFSSQSGVQTAVDDALISGLRANAVDGTLSVRAALERLLTGTPLTFEQVGASTVVIRRLAAMPLEAARVAHPVLVARDVPADTVVPDTPLDTLTVAAMRPVLDRKTAQEGLYEFIAHHSTVHYVNMGGAGNLARWRGGRGETICASTVGLDETAGGLVTDRLREVATLVGAPVDRSDQCKGNVRFFFTDDPLALMDQITLWAAHSYFRTSEARVRRLLGYDPDHAIQGWYLTASGGDRALNTDVVNLRLHLLPLWPTIVRQAQDDPGDESGIAGVILLVDIRKVSAVSIGTVADYLAVLTLSVAQLPDHCDPLPSILDHMAPSCASRPPPAEATRADLAFLRALYYKNTGLGRSPTRSDIEGQMLNELMRDEAAHQGPAAPAADGVR